MRIQILTLQTKLVDPNLMLETITGIHSNKIG